MPTSKLLSGVIILTSLTALLVCDDASAEPSEVLVPAQVMAVDLPIPNNAPWTAARKAAAQQLVGLAKRNGAKTFGFNAAPSDESQLTILNPLREAMVDVVALKSYEPLVPPGSLINFQDRLTFPVLVGGRVVSSFTLRRDGNAWKPVAFGSANLIRAAMQARIKLVTTPSPLTFLDRKADYALVSITGLNLQFLYAKGPLGPYLAPLRGSTHYGWKAGVPLRLQDVFMKLKPDAIAHNGLPT